MMAEKSVYIINSIESSTASSEVLQQGAGEPVFFQLGEVREAKDTDFDYFRRLAEYHDNWIKRLDNNGLTVWQKETGHSTIKMAKV